MKEILEKYKTDLENELFQILDFWQKNTVIRPTADSMER